MATIISVAFQKGWEVAAWDKCATRQPIL
jgi:hypothetical protein